ncbi:hypothetical protein [Sphingobacterium sp. DR205]|uniref:hypothetical protein n=1 Tax=Sphingobacterium sp. DR205 TaxID=2713573 RepID=UPI0013E51134|nr:hypothetical protein [Sphingobacterium sp. DR205]QIH34804.1 hypothetical protein G6053_18725 [Sphingobacterium sp. DR205]
MYIDKYYPFKSQDAIDITNTVSGKYYKVCTFISKTSYVISGLIQITDYRQVPEIADINVYVKGLNPLRTSVNQLSLSTSAVDNNLTPNNIFWNITTDADKIKYELYIKANATNRDWKINFSELYLNSNVINSDIIVYNRPDPEDNLPTGSNISSISPIRLSYNASTYIQGIQSVNATNQSDLTAITLTDLVSQINTLLLPKFNEIVTLVNETKAKTNQSISTEVASGQRRSS